MSLNWKPVADYAENLYQLLTKFEAPHLDARLVGGNITIGLGFDMDVGDPVLKDAVLAKMGILQTNVLDKPYYDRLILALKGTSISAVNAILAERAADPAVQPCRRNALVRLCARASSS